MIDLNAIEYAVQETFVPDVWTTIVVGTHDKPLDLKHARGVVRGVRDSQMDGGWRVIERGHDGVWRTREEARALLRQPGTFGPAWADRSADPATV